MHRINRLQAINDYITRNGKAEVSQLAAALNVSEATVRRDLALLVSQKKILRSHGGAVLNENFILDEYPYELRLSQNVDKKTTIARKALSLIKPGSYCFFDCSTTVMELAKLITDQKFLAITDTLVTAIELTKKENVTVLMLGGTVNKTTISSTGPFALSMLNNMHLSVAFLGLPSISMDGSMSVSGINDYEIKRALFRQAEKKVVLVDSSKIVEPRFLKIGNLSDVDMVITDKDITPDFANLCKSFNCELVIADD